MILGISFVRFKYKNIITLTYLKFAGVFINGIVFLLPANFPTEDHMFS